MGGSPVRVDFSNAYGFGKFFGKTPSIQIDASIIELFYRATYFSAYDTIGRIVGQNGHDDLYFPFTCTQTRLGTDKMLQTAAKLLQD